VKIPIIVCIAFSTFVALNIGYSADSNTVSVTAVILSKSQCKFNSKTSTLNFGSLDPVNPVDKTVDTTIKFRCGGSASNATFFISDDDGLYETKPDANRMRHTTNTAEFLPYTLTLNPVSGTVPRNTDQTLTITGTVKGIDYQDALVGSFSDRVVISINP